MPSLEFMADPNGGTQRIVLTPLPFILGRGGKAHFTLRSHLVSKEHAEIYLLGEKLFIRDLGSRNGTFVNGHRIVEASLAQGDIIHVAHSEFRFHEDSGLEVPVDSGFLAETEPAPSGVKIPPSVLHGKPLLQEMIDKLAVRVIFQPIADLHTRAIIGFEALGRGNSPTLSTRPADLFRLASRCGLASELSEVFRRIAVKRAETLPAGVRVFCNLHPDELTLLRPERFERLLADLPAQHPLVLEVHEDAVPDLGMLRQLRDYLRTRDVGLAYDDFGAGQSRLAELADVPPDFIKLDMRLIRNIHLASGRRDVVSAISEAAHKLGVTVVAEGLEKQEELDVCQKLGCRLGQGFLLGHPEQPGV